eukprot:m.223380 g.223380  ORF g.223380 m.223380 type:complete len:521 (-) comp16245_c0_seq1:54-1616(-)
MAEEDDVREMDALHKDASAPQVETFDAMQRLRLESEKRLRTGAVGEVSGSLWTQGKLWGWAKKLAVVEGRWLNLYSKPEDIPLHSTFLQLDVAGCEATLVSATKYGRDHCFEVIIANPRAVHAFAADSIPEAEQWIAKLKAIKVEEKMPEGFVGNLTPPQEQALAALKAKLGADATGDADLLRFLRASSFNPETANTLFVENLIWRKSFGVEKMTVNYVARELRVQKLRLLPTLDKRGRPIVVLRPAKHIPSESSPLEVCKCLTYLMETAIKRMGAGVEAVTAIVDLQGMHPRNVDFRVPKLILETLQQRYPERIALTLVVNAPWFFRFVWATVRRFFGPELLQKVHILGADMSTLQAFVPAESLLKDHGGVIDYDPDEFIAERAAAEGVVGASEAGFSPQEGGIDQSLLATLRELPAAEAREGATRVGYMSKIGGVVKNWKRRFFVLSSSGLLYYYKDEKSDAPQGVIMLERSTVGEETLGKSHAFSVITPLRTYVFACENDADLAEWRKAVTDVCASL